MTFDLAAKPDAPPTPASSADFTTVIIPDGQLGIVEFIGALPRASLIPTWQIDTNDAETLQILGSPNFDPHQTVLVADSIPASPPPGPSAGTGTVSITDYAPKRVVLAADINSPTVPLMTDHAAFIIPGGR